MKAMLCIVLGVAVAAGAADVKYPKCFDASREGRCFVLRVNGQASTKISGKTKKILKPLDGLTFDSEETRYEVAVPVRGALEVSAEWLPEAVPYFGNPPGVEVFVKPLEGQRLETSAALSTAGSVNVGGQSVVTLSNVLRDNRLPPGKYLMEVRASGARANWDRQVVYFEVGE
jgi:hypothetical protein